MPIYEYNCEKCGIFELSQGIKDKPLSDCPTCGGPVNRLISLTAFHLKGSGWYKTDYGSSGSGKKETKTSETSVKPTETKTAETTSGSTTTSESTAPASGSDKGSAKQTQSSSSPAA